MIPKRLRTTRELANMSQEELAAAAGGLKIRALQESHITNMAGINQNLIWYAS